MELRLGGVFEAGAIVFGEFWVGHQRLAVTLPPVNRLQDVLVRRKNDRGGFGLLEGPVYGRRLAAAGRAVEEVYPPLVHRGLNRFGLFLAPAIDAFAILRIESPGRFNVAGGVGFVAKLGRPVPLFGEGRVQRCPVDRAVVSKVVKVAVDLVLPQPSLVREYRRSREDVEGIVGERRGLKVFRTGATKCLPRDRSPVAASERSGLADLLPVRKQLLPWNAVVEVIPRGDRRAGWQAFSAAGRAQGLGRLSGALP